MGETPSITLPDIPSQPVEVEDCASGLFNAAGYQVQRNIHQRGETDEVLELDVVATDYRQSPRRTVLVEAKSGGWGYSDLFKVLGWMRYLSIAEGSFFVTTVPAGKDVNSMNDRFRSLGLQVIYLVPHADFLALFIQAGYGAQVDGTAYDVWRYFYAVERAMIKYLRDRKRSAPSLRSPVELLEYYGLINDEIFFEPDAFRRLRGLYRAFAEHPRLSLGVAHEIDGKGFDPASEDPNSPAMRAAVYKGEHDLLQAAFYLEHRARLAILKAAIDLDLDGKPPKPVITARGKPLVTEWDFLPASFRNGLDALRGHPSYSLYPTLWQVFLWTMGGFILRDREDQEHQWLSSMTGVPLEEVPAALTAFDLLFPTDGSWFIDSHNSCCHLVRLVPTPVQGLGAHHRLEHYGVKNYEELGYSDYTVRDLGKWHAAGYGLLKRRGDLAVEP